MSHILRIKGNFDLGKVTTELIINFYGKQQQTKTITNKTSYTVIETK